MVLLESSCRVKFNEVYFIIFISASVEDIKFWMNVVVESSNKLQKIVFRRENELCVFILGANKYVTLSIHEGR
jgi:hypothetical protein